MLSVEIAQVSFQLKHYNNKLKNKTLTAQRFLNMPNILMVQKKDDTTEKLQELICNKLGTCDMASNGKEALKFLQNHTYDLIITDIVMPQMDGFTLLDMLQKNQKTKDIPVVVLSNLTQESDIITCLEKGACSYLLKNQIPLPELIEQFKIQLSQSIKQH